MAKMKTHFVCQNCGTNSTKWMGKCPSCETWNSLVEERLDGGGDQKDSISSIRQEFRTDTVSTLQHKAHRLGDLNAGSKPKARIQIGISELDRVLGGGLVSDSFVLLGGDPGIGKSTLLLQMANAVGDRHRVLYVSGEESVDQIRMRATRLGVTPDSQIFLAGETELEAVFHLVREVKPEILVLDSLQTFSSSQIDSPPGSVSQVREIASRLMTLAKSAGISVWLVGHVTKEGSIAGPKVVEHLVDTVLYFEGDEGMSFRLLRSVKNRFGSSRELSVFEMDGEGLKEVKNPSSLFLSERPTPLSGTAVTAIVEGSRPILVELQALVAPSPLAMPRRTSVGLDHNRLSILAAISERHLGISLSQRDLFFYVVGGLKISEPACDLGAIAAIWSSFKDIPLPKSSLFLGEVGLTGEVRKVSQMEMRIEEAAKLGYKKLIVPKTMTDRIPKSLECEVIGVSHLNEFAKRFS
ncbi:MAG: DNA repair protein RadA [Xanthomonadaceae bacterium]|nr:DNA repair protein RadA [Xanthomonadaceae bacterium]